MELVDLVGRGIQGEYHTQPTVWDWKTLTTENNIGDRES